MVSWEDFIPFYDFFFAIEEVPIEPEPIPEEPPEIFSFLETYEYTRKAIEKLQGDNVSEELQRLNINMCLGPFIATLIFLTFVYSFVLLFRWSFVHFYLCCSLS